MSINAEVGHRKTWRSSVWRPETDRTPGLPAEFWTLHRRFAVLAALACFFVVLHGGSLDLGESESRLGLASHESLGPFGQVFGGWDPSVRVGQLVPSLMWSWGEGFMTTMASVRWPAVIAGVAIGLVLARRAAGTLNGKAAVLVGFCWYGSLGLIDRSSATGLDLITGLWTVAAIDRILNRGSDLAAGVLLSLAFLCGGWPPIAIVALATVVMGRSGSGLSWRLLVPPAMVAAAWSAWALKVAPAEAWAAALTLPLTEKPAWLLAPGVILLGLPWSPLAAIVLSRPMRASLTPRGRSLVIGWLQVAGACLLAGTLIPGIATAASVPALAGLAVASAAVCERMLLGIESNAARRWFAGSAVVLGLFWAVTVCAAGGYLTAAVAYYRGVAIILIVLGVPAACLAVFSASRRDVRGSWLAFLILAVSLKLAHAGYYVPEWNYRISQGPWGRAVGQWVPPKWPIYTTTAWRADLAFATEHPVHRLISPQHLQYQPGEARYVLLLGAEFDNWPENAAKLNKVAEFRDEFDARRVLARTDGPLPWTRPASGRDVE